MEVLDNFLNEKTFFNLKKHIEDHTFDWHWIGKLNPNSDKDKEFCFSKMFITTGDREGWWRSDDVDFYLKPLMDRLKEHLNYNKVEVYRAKANLFLRNDKRLEYGFHHDIVDRDNNYETLLFFVNDNNGGIEFEDKTFIRQKQNRAVIIKGKKYHQSIGQTDELRRINININYTQA